MAPWPPLYGVDVASTPSQTIVSYPEQKELWERLTEEQYCDQWEGPKTPDNLVHRGRERCLSLLGLDRACDTSIFNNQELLSQRGAVVEARHRLGFSGPANLPAEAAQLTELAGGAADNEWSIAREYQPSCMN